MQLLNKFLILLCLLTGFSYPQDGYGQSRKVKKAQKEADKKKEAQKEAYEKAKKADMAHRYSLQTDETKKRMKQTRKKADQFNNKYHETCFKRIFKRKH